MRGLLSCCDAWVCISCQWRSDGRRTAVKSLHSGNFGRFIQAEGACVAIVNSEVPPKRKVSPSKHSAEFSAVVTEPEQAPAPVPSVASLHLDMSKLPRIVLLASIAFAILFVAFQGLVSLASILLLATCCMHAGAASTLPFLDLCRDLKASQGQLSRLMATTCVRHMSAGLSFTKSERAAVLGTGPHSSVVNAAGDGGSSRPLSSEAVTASAIGECCIARRLARPRSARHETHAD